jgi:hypothetical protein
MSPKIGEVLKYNFALHYLFQFVQPEYPIFRPYQVDKAGLQQLNELFLKFIKKKHFQFISFTFESPSSILKIRKKYNINYPVITLSADSIFFLTYKHGFPTNMIVDLSGKIIFYKSGGFTDKELARSDIEKYFISELHKMLD